MKIGEWGKFPKRRGRVRTSRQPGKALCSQRMYLSHFLNKSHYYLKDIEIPDSVQIGVPICTDRHPKAMAWQLWVRYRFGPR
jgi:hypothetical protein